MENHHFSWENSLFLWPRFVAKLPDLAESLLKAAVARRTWRIFRIAWTRHGEVSGRTGAAMGVWESGHDLPVNYQNDMENTTVSCLESDVNFDQSYEF